MRVVLFDIRTEGHHVKYVRYLAQHLLENRCEVAFVTLRRDRSIDLLLGDLPRLVIQYQEPRRLGALPRNPIGLFLRMWKALTECYRFAAAWGATHVCIMSADYCELPLLLRTISWHKRDWQLFGFLIWPYAQPVLGSRVRLVKRAYRALRRWALRSVMRDNAWHGLFVHTEWTRASLLARLSGRRQMSAQVVVVPDPCEPLERTCSVAEARSRLLLPNDACIVLFFGVLRWDKGIDILLDAFAGLDQDVTLLIAGQEDYVTGAEIETYKKRLTNPDSVIARIGYVTPDDEKLYFAAADAVILPYRTAFRGTSGIMQNAVCAQKPVITTDVGALGDLARKYSLGVVVRPESAEALRQGVQDFMQNRAAISSLAQASAADYVDLHHWKKMAVLVEATLQGKEVATLPDRIAG